MNNCNACGEPMPSDGDGVACSVCQDVLHFECSTLKASSWRTMGPTRRATWRCAKCYMASKGKKTGGSDPTGGSDLEDDNDSEPEAVPVDMQQMMDMMGKRLGVMEEKMEKMFTAADSKATKKFEEFITSLNYYGEKVDDATNTVKSMEQKLIMMEKRIEKSENENKELKTRLRNMEKQLNELGQKEFSSKIEISGIKDSSINQDEVVKKILQKIDDSGVIQFRAHKTVFKVGEEKTEKTSILVAFQSNEIRNKVLSQIKEKKIYQKLEGILPNAGESVFINEALSPYYKKLLFEASRVKKDKKFAYLWVKDGRLLLKKTEQGNILRLECMDDLGKL